MRTSITARLSILLISMWFMYVSAGEKAAEYIAEAGSAYENQDYSQAKSLYEKALNEGAVNAELYYNYANTLFRLNMLGKAILNYEKARKLSPDNKDLQANLKFAYAMTVDKYPQTEHNLITRFIWSIHSGYNLNFALWAVLGIYTFIFLLGILLLFLPANTRVLIYPVAGLLAIVLVIASPSVYFRIHEQESIRFGIVLSPVLPIYSGPGESYEILSKVHEGTKFEIEEMAGDWAKVKLPNGKGGYVEFKELGKI